MDIRAVLARLRRHLVLIALVAIAATGLAAFLAHRQPVMYRANAVIRLGDGRRAIAGNLVSSPSPALSGRIVDPLMSLVEVLTSGRVLGQVVDTVPILRLHTVGFMPSLLKDVAIDRGAERDSVALRFEATRVTAATPGSQAAVPYGQPVHVAGITFTVAAPPRAEHGAVLLRSREAALERLRRGLRVVPRQNTDVADVFYTDADPRLAQEVANRAVESFRLTNAQSAQAQSRLRREFVEEQLRQNEAELIRAQQDLSAFRSKVQLYSSKERLSAEQTSLAAIDVRRQELASDLQTYRSLLAALETATDDARAVSALISAPGVAGNPVVLQSYNRWESLRAARDSLTAGPWGATKDNPEVLRVDTLIRAARGALLESARSLVASTESRLQGIDALKNQNADAFRQISGKEADEAQLVGKVDALRGISSQLRAEYQRAQIEEAAELGEVEIIDQAGPPGRWEGAGPLRKTAYGGIIGLVLGCGLALLLEQLNTSIRRRDQIRSALQLPELAVIPQLRQRRFGRRLRSRHPAQITGGTAASPALDAKLVAASDLYSSGAEAYRLLRTNLLFANPARTPKSVLVTSPAPGDGKTTIAANLAVTFAQQGMTVVLIDCDLRRGRLHQVFDVPREPGVSQVLRGQIAPEQGIAGTTIERLAIMPMGTVPKNPAELLGAPAMRELLDRLARQYDVLVLDAPPVLAAVDASLAAVLVDATVVVLRAGETGEDEARQALTQLHTVGARIAGAVLNDQNATVERYGGYYYSGYYGAREPD
ncbi:MAG TPA: polysaccharide biosynthesis tyrosine autokinase [Gemmatimonadales bacterium]|nr:polysaccharide biosynthesis tyrosine autokinase [Gemmatimonadales bacterium]